MIIKEKAYYTLENGKEILMEEVALSNLLMDCVIFPCEAQDRTEHKMIGLAVSANDLFVPGNDAELLTLNELEEFYGYYRKHDVGPTIWMCMKRKLSPRQRIWNAMNANKDLWKLFPKEMKKIKEFSNEERNPSP